MDCTPAPINIGSSPKEVFELDLKSVNEVKKVYRNIVELATREEDNITRSIYEEILAEEEKQKHILMCVRGRAIKRIWNKVKARRPNPPNFYQSCSVNESSACSGFE